jgi:hypothetical protein
MSISSLRVAGAAAVLAAAIALVASPRDPAMGGALVHPAWLVAIVLAARYGLRGLIAVPAVVVGIAAAALLVGDGPLDSLELLERPNDLAVLLATAVIAWIGGIHEARKGVLEARLREVTASASDAERDARELAEAALVLRERGDRATSSLAFVADIAIELASRSPARVGRAALDLAIARTGARGGAVQVVDGSVLRTLAVRGVWSHDQIEPPALFRDRVAIAAIERKLVVAAHEVRDVRVEDSDLAAPLVGDDGVVHGVLALRGLASPARAREDVVAIAWWTGQSLASSFRDAGPAAQARRGSARAHV